MSYGRPWRVHLRPARSSGVGGRRQAPDGRPDPSMTMAELLTHLDGVRSVSGGFQARCPAHDDQEPSLSLREAEDRILAKCHAGCETSDVLEALGLRWRDLWFDSGPATRDQRKAYWEEPEAVYIYRDADGDELYRVVRLPGKRFKQ